MADDKSNTVRTVSPSKYNRLKHWSQSKPRLALMGEFSAGKSTLLNFLIEENVLPTRATATELPPVWFSHGSNGSYWLGEDGVRNQISVEELSKVPPSAKYVRLFVEAEILEHCDVIDTPGISDPNLAVETWRVAAGYANMVLWCTSATQAWRQTERSAWLSLPERLRKHSILVVTRSDKLTTEVDRDKVARRMAREAEEHFAGTVFMSTPNAVHAKAELANGQETPLWNESGAGPLLDMLASRLEGIYEDKAALFSRYKSTDGTQEVPAEAAEPSQPVQAEAPAQPVQEEKAESDAVPAKPVEEPAAKVEEKPAPSEEAPKAARPVSVIPPPVQVVRPQVDRDAATPRPERPPAEEVAGVPAATLAEAVEETVAPVEAVKAPVEEAPKEPVAEKPAVVEEKQPQAEPTAVAPAEPSPEPTSEPEVAAPAATVEATEAKVEEAPAAEEAPKQEEVQPEPAEATVSEEVSEQAAPEAAPAKETVPPQVKLWREIVARTSENPSNEQMVSMIDELLHKVFADAAPSGDAGTSASEKAAENQAKPQGENKENSQTGWRRLA